MGCVGCGGVGKEEGQEDEFHLKTMKFVLTLPGRVSILSTRGASAVCCFALV